MTCSYYSVIGAKLKKKEKKKLPLFTNYQLIAEAHVFSTDCAFFLVSHSCSEVHVVRPVRVVFQMFALQGSRGFATKLTDVCP